MFLFGSIRYVDFRIQANGTTVTSLAQVDLAPHFTRNGVTCTDALTFTELGDGRYQFSYTPSAAGHDVLDIHWQSSADVTKFFFATNSEDIVAPAMLLGGSVVINLTQNTPTTNALKVTQVVNPAAFTLYVYLSSDWQAGNTDTSQAIASTQLDSSGNWLTAILPLTPGTYHIVIRDSLGTVQVIQAYLQLPIGA
jgi:hypothetical protein